MFSHDNLMNHYKTNFSLMHHHKYSLAELETMIPWERMLYTQMIIEHNKLQEELAKERQIQQENAARAAQRSAGRRR